MVVSCQRGGLALFPEAVGRGSAGHNAVRATVDSGPLMTDKNGTDLS